MTIPLFAKSADECQVKQRFFTDVKALKSGLLMVSPLT
jgi:hypothetical protein